MFYVMEYPCPSACGNIQLREPGSYCDGRQVDWHFERAQGVSKDQVPTSVAPLVSNFEGGEKFDTLSAECSKLCQDDLRGIETGSSQTFAKNTCEEQHYDGLSFEEKIKIDEEMMTREMLLSLTNSSTKSLLLTHLATANVFGAAREVVERLKVLHKLSDSRTDSAPINLMIKGAQEMELSTIRSIKERVQLEKQQEGVLGNLSRIGQRAILNLRKLQHQSLMELLRKTEATQTSKLEEFVDDKFKFVNEIQKTKKETESIVDWLSHHTARATDKIKRANMIEKTKLEEKIAKSEEQGEKSKAELQAALMSIRMQHPLVLSASRIWRRRNGNKRNRDSVVLRKRVSFVPCMQASMCSKCSDEAWERYKRCPVCNTLCPSKPLPTFIMEYLTHT